MLATHCSRASFAFDEGERRALKAASAMEKRVRGRMLGYETEKKAPEASIAANAV